METQIRKFQELRQELLNNKLKFSRQHPRSEDDILNEMGNVIDEMGNLLDYPTNNILHEFFNHKSDANKYLNAEQQEDLENDFYEWVKNNDSVVSFNEAVEPAIRYLFNNCEPCAINAVNESNMTEQEKAVRIIKSYIAICNRWNEDYVESQTVEELKKSALNNQWWIPKKAALQACDIAMESHGDLEYWQNVKNSINAF